MQTELNETEEAEELAALAAQDDPPGAGATKVAAALGLSELDLEDVENIALLVSNEALEDAKKRLPAGDFKWTQIQMEQARRPQQKQKQNLRSLRP